MCYTYSSVHYVSDGFVAVTILIMREMLKINILIYNKTNIFTLVVFASLIQTSDGTDDTERLTLVSPK